MVDRVYDAVSATHLDGLEVAFVSAKILEHVRLQVAIDYEDGASCHVLQCLLEGPQHRLHRLKRCLRGEDKLDILVDLLDFFDVDFLGSVAATKSTKGCHRVTIYISERGGVHITNVPTSSNHLLLLQRLFLFDLNLLLFLFKNLFDPLNVPY